MPCQCREACNVCAGNILQGSQFRAPPFGFDLALHAVKALMMTVHCRRCACCLQTCKHTAARWSAPGGAP